MANILSGKETAAALDEKIRAKVSALSEAGVVPRLLILRVGEKKSDLSYESGASKRAAKLGISCISTVFPEDVEEEMLIHAIKEANLDDTVHGVLLLRPLPAPLDAHRIANALDPAKDVDGMTDGSAAGIFSGKEIGFGPCTPQACLEILDHYGISCEGKKAVVIGRSMVVGRPLAMMLLKRNATVTICHTKTADLPQEANQADLLFVSAGKAGIVNRDFVKPGQIVIDVGINVNEEGKMTGDVDFASVEPVVQAVTPVPGGVGAVTTSVLLDHVVTAASRKAGV